MAFSGTAEGSDKLNTKRDYKEACEHMAECVVSGLDVCRRSTSNLKNGYDMGVTHGYGIGISNSMARGLKPTR